MTGAITQQDAPVISDADYDALRQRNEAIEARFPDLVRGDSPSRRVGAAPRRNSARSAMRCRCCRSTMPSRTRTSRDFVGRVRRFLSLGEDEALGFTAEPKIDGLSISLRYEDAGWSQAATRGDGAEGENVTANVRTLEDMPQAPQGRCAGSDRGARRDLHVAHGLRARSTRKQAEAGERPFANPRNAAAGSLAPARSDDHRLASAALLRLCLGRGAGASRRRRRWA